MKPLEQEDLPVLAKIIRENTAYKVYIRNGKIFIKSIKRLIAIITIRRGQIFSTKKIIGIPMAPCFYILRQPDWQILI